MITAYYLIVMASAPPAPFWALGTSRTLNYKPCRWGERWAGVLATAGGVLVYADPNGDLVAVDQEDGERLWSGRFEYTKFRAAFNNEVFYVQSAWPYWLVLDGGRGESA